MVFCFFFVFWYFHTRILFKSRSFWARLMKNVLVFQRFCFPACCLAWLLLESCLSLAWVLLHSCFSLVPRLKLVFRGSYFLLLIGSPGPPRKRLPQASPASFLRFHTRILIKNEPFWQFVHINHNGFWVFFCFLHFHKRVLFKSRSFWARLIKNVMVFQRFSAPACTLAWLLLESCFILASLLFPD